MNPGLSRKEITDTLAALHKLTKKYRNHMIWISYSDIDRCPLCVINEAIFFDKQECEDEEEVCQYCPHTYLDDLPLMQNQPPCVRHNNYIPAMIITDHPELALKNFTRINRWIHQLVYMLMETPE